MMHIKLFAFAVACLVFVYTPLFAEERRPNIIFIMADDLGWGDVGFNGQEVIKTPNLDRLASEGMVFDQYYSGATVCAPSRAVLMTGRHAGRVSVRGNISPQLTLDPEEKTIAEVMKSAGYTTAMVGKWGLGGADKLPDYGGTGKIIPEAKHGLPTRRGFDFFFGYLDQVSAHDYHPQYLWKNEEPYPLEGNYGVPRGERTTYSHDVMTQKVLEIIAAADGETPLYLDVSYLIPHRETIAPPGPNPYADRDWPEVEKAFAAMITYMDHEVGMIAEAVASNPAICDNTLLIFTSDNGPQATDGHSPDFFRSSGPFRGAKRDLYEGGIRVPFFAWWPQRIAGGVRTREIADAADLLPTFASLAAVSAPADIDGRSLAPIFFNESTFQLRTVYIWGFVEDMGGPGEEVARLAVRENDWKLIIKKDGTRELYNLERDPGEMTNLASQFPVRVSALEAILRENVNLPWPDVEFSK